MFLEGGRGMQPLQQGGGGFLTSWKGSTTRYFPIWLNHVALAISNDRETQVKERETEIQETQWPEGTSPQLNHGETACMTQRPVTLVLSKADLAKADQAPALTWATDLRRGPRKHSAFGSPLENGPDSFSKSLAPTLGRPHCHTQVLARPFTHSGEWTKMTCSLSLAAVFYVFVCSASPLNINFFENRKPPFSLWSCCVTWYISVPSNCWKGDLGTKSPKKRH